MDGKGQRKVLQSMNCMRKKSLSTTRKLTKGIYYTKGETNKKLTTGEKAISKWGAKQE